MEMLLVVGLLALVAGMAVPVYQSLQNRSELGNTTHALMHALRRAHTLARTGQHDTSWGVHISAQQVTLFQGTSYASRVTDFDEITEIRGSIAVSGDTEYVFAKFTGEPASVGVTTLTSADGVVRTVTVGAKGVITFSLQRWGNQRVVQDGLLQKTT